MSSGYYHSAHWKRLRDACLDRDNHCCVVKGCKQPGVVADHIETRSRSPIPTPADRLDNLRTLCLQHDAQVKEQNGIRKQGGKFRIKGCDADGRALDPDHAWNR